MRLRIIIEPQDGADYGTQLRLARAAEQLGFDGFFRSDHFLKMADVSGLPGPTDAWITLAGLARETIRIRLGTLMTAATFRAPGPLAIAVAQVDQMSGGRVELGLGAGWFKAEHTAYGVRFPGVAERFERLEEQLAIITGIWGTAVGDTFSFHGKHYWLVDSPALPKPAQQQPPILIGGLGARRTPRLAARYADEFNLPYGRLDAIAAAFDRVRTACAEIGRDAPPRLSASQHVSCGRSEAEVARRAEAAGHDVDELRIRGLAGSPSEIVDKLGRLECLGATHVYMQCLGLADLDHLELVGTTVLPQVHR
jgi:F420-dependent oxidoreductase-like protein